ncbi:MAG: amino acid permease [Anaerolineae bacterium]|nr:amino acid permease [Anaerolineae bacterium]
MTQATDTARETAKKGVISLRGAVFIGIGSMVGAGIFALFGEAGAIAGAAVWVSFLVGGIIALLQGYSFAKLGARYPSAGGLIDWIVRGYGKGLFTGGIVMLGFFTYIIVTAMVAVSFGNYFASLLLGEDVALVWVKLFSVVIIVALTLLNLIGAGTVAKAQTAIVLIVLVVLVGFAIAMLAQLNPALLAPANYPPPINIFASVALTFFAYLGFGVIAFTGGDIQEPKKNLPRAMYISLGFTMLLYVALAVGVFGTLSVEEVIASADTALAVAALPIFGALGYTMISIAAVFATTGATNSQLYATIGAAYAMAKEGYLPPSFGLKFRGGAEGTRGMVIGSAVAIALAVFFDLSAIASVGSAVALAIFALITVAHLRMAKETGASRAILVVALVGTSLAILLFAWYTLLTDPATFVFLVATIVLAWVVEAIWLRMSKRAARSEQ